MTFFVVLPFAKDAGGNLVPGEPQEARDAAQAQRHAHELALTHGGAIAFSRTGDPQLGSWGAPEIIAREGDVPDDPARAVTG
ncbi:hypothetical protein QNA08_08090 [Chelatococcus sp. SYSU_G07232]|uniref:Uncharacterized protein n=1 Tax=Chelatococcus albus TaxID=3047466 RepID=A0ABT7AFR7_9HYPH|nr:hypothetical protein [Chelatococcus sp. SYSU_G07232]MDJ1158191.1 hypothetical protein [Chelatococcus sp. SYSU_G07232]